MNTPESDTDIKSVFIPDGREILLGTVNDAIQERPDADIAKRDSDDETLFSLRKLLMLAAENQVIAMEMIFAPERFYLCDPDPAWIDIIENRHRLVSKNIDRFAGYARRQAGRYVFRGDRMAAVKATIDALEAAQQRLGGSRNSVSGQPYRVEDALAEIEEAMSRHSYIGFRDTHNPDGKLIRHLECCDKQVHLTISIDEALDIYGRQYRNYGIRSERARLHGGADWKAMSHAIRLADSALELLETGRMELPHPKRDLYLAIKLGKLPADDVIEMIDQGLEKVEQAARVSSLPAEPDMDWIRRRIVKSYREAVLADAADPVPSRPVQDHEFEQQGPACP